MKKIIFLNRFFAPDHSATSQLLSDLAFYLAACGSDVRALTSRQRYDRPRAALPQTETIRGVAVYRLATTRFGRSTLLGRGLDYCSFYFSMWRAALALAERGDILVAKTDPPLLSVVAMKVARRRGLRLVTWQQDLYPEIATLLGLPFVKGPLGRGLARLRDRSLRAAEANVVVGDRMADRLRSRGLSPDRIHVIPNWCNDEEIRPIARCDNPLRREWGLAGRFVVGYSGNLGRAHEFDTVLGAAEQLRDEPSIVFLLIGGGNKFDELRRRVKERSLDGLFRFIPYQELAVLRYSLGVPDLHWISLKPELEGVIFPSKLYGIAAAGRPIIAIAAEDGEIGSLVRSYDCGVVIAPGDSGALAAALRDLSTDRCRLAAMGQRARQLLDSHFTRRQAFARWRALLSDITSRSET
jgi:colanic acid biosynthesis glycosyl transferase WcaI